MSTTSVPRVGLLYLSMDRLEYTSATIPCLDQPGVSVLWYDDSRDPDAVAFGEAWQFERAKLMEKKRSGVKGPAAAIHVGLKELYERCDCEWLGYYENDILCADGWLDSVFASVAAAEANGYKVGSVSPDAPLAKITNLEPGYGWVWDTGQVVLFPRECVPIVLEQWYQFASLARFVRLTEKRELTCPTIQSFNDA